MKVNTPIMKFSDVESGSMMVIRQAEERTLTPGTKWKAGKIEVSPKEGHLAISMNGTFVLDKELWEKIKSGVDKAFA